ncbi:MAG: hypothetical protein JXK94_03640 [Deltaproteobacteria bacterium]|nr:hypothetical protein [Deltaproteobacteria bacterium]
MNIAFVACNRKAERFRQDPSFIYRCENLSLALQAAGHQPELVHLSTFPSNQKFDVVIFHRPRWNWRLCLILARLRRSGTVAIADVDDLVFDDKYAKFSPGVKNGLVPLGKTTKQYVAHRKALARFTIITVSTEPLAEHARKLFPSQRIEVIHNAIHFSWLKKPVPEPHDSSPPVITYFPGTRSHDQDFSGISDALSQFLRRHPEARLQITGPLKFAIEALPEQVLYREKVPFSSFAELFRDAWVNLAPLEPTPFNRCKSALKIMEAGYWNVPTICSPTPDASRFEGAGASLANEPAAWVNYLEAFLDTSCYREATSGLRARVMKRSDIVGHAEHLVQIAVERRKGIL